jgi:hypothetical protein
VSHAAHGRDKPWPFPGPENQMVFCCVHVLEGSRPILRVTHDEHDESWQILCGHPHDGEDARVVCLGCMLARDETLREVANLPLDWCADRASMEGPWERSECGPL